MEAVRKRRIMVRVCKRQKIRSVQQLIAHAEAVNAAFYRRRCVKFERERERASSVVGCCLERGSRQSEGESVARVREKRVRHSLSVVVQTL